MNTELLRRDDPPQYQRNSISYTIRGWSIAIEEHGNVSRFIDVRVPAMLPACLEGYGGHDQSDNATPQAVRSLTKDSVSQCTNGQTKLIGTQYSVYCQITFCNALLPFSVYTNESLRTHEMAIGHHTGINGLNPGT